MQEQVYNVRFWAENHKSHEMKAYATSPEAARQMVHNHLSECRGGAFTVLEAIPQVLHLTVDYSICGAYLYTITIDCNNDTYTAVSAEILRQIGRDDCVITIHHIQEV